MKQKITVALNEELVAFLDSQAQGNRSEYLNALLVREHRQSIKTQLIEALQQDIQEPNYRDEIKTWDSVVGDGINAER